MTESGNDFRRELERIRDDLTTLKDEVRLKLHLASMDAKDAYERLEPRIRDFSRHVDAVGDAVEREAEKIGTRLRDELVDLRDRVRKAVDKDRENG